jgi:hypothetical protein
MRVLFIVIILVVCQSVSAQQERDTVLRRCPVFITDTVSGNNFFIEGLPATLKVYRVKGELTIQFQQKEQFFSLFFHDKKLKNTKYKIEAGSNKNSEVEVSYSFKSGEQVSFIAVSKGTVETVFDNDKNMWRIKVNGLIGNMIERTVTYYRVRVDFYIK